jgi:hypothetical protein
MSCEGADSAPLHGSPDIGARDRGSDLSKDAQPREYIKKQEQEITADRPPSGGQKIGAASATPTAASSGSLPKAPGSAGGYLPLLRSKATNADPWVIGLRRRRPSLVVAVALANKTARIAWAVMHRQEDYQRMAAAA